MDTKFVDGLYDRLEGELLELGSNIEFYPRRLAAISGALKELKAHVVRSGFLTDLDEVIFFKFVKPRFYMLYIYEVELFNR